MKLLLDENLSRRLVPFLLHDYPGTTHVTLLGLEQATDMMIWQRAKADGYVLVTRDADFHEIGLVHGQPPPIIWIKAGNPSKTVALKLLLDCREAIELAIEKDGLGLVELRA
jgi:predicted nuclease of predicted toxin-antitoxin system